MQLRNSLAQVAGESDAEDDDVDVDEDVNGGDFDVAPVQAASPQKPVLAAAPAAVSAAGAGASSPAKSLIRPVAASSPAAGISKQPQPPTSPSSTPFKGLPATSSASSSTTASYADAVFADHGISQSNAADLVAAIESLQSGAATSTSSLPPDVAAIPAPELAKQLLRSDARTVLSDALSLFNQDGDRAAFAEILSVALGQHRFAAPTPVAAAAGGAVATVADKAAATPTKTKPASAASPRG